MNPAICLKPREYSFDEFDSFLLSKNGRIIHQLWGFFKKDSKSHSKKLYEKLSIYRESWIKHNPTWFRFEWDDKLGLDLMKKIFPEHLSMYKKYKYDIQRCDAIRYFILYRYGGLYADMDYYCNRPFDEAIKEYPNDIYFVQTPNKTILQESDHVSNSLIYSKPGHVFWRNLFVELEMSKDTPSYYTHHMAVMFSTGPNMLNRAYIKLKYRCKLSSYPAKYFQPYGLECDVLSLKNDPQIFAIHLSNGSWEKSDSKVILFFFTEWKIVMFIILLLLVPNITQLSLNNKHIN